MPSVALGKGPCCRVSWSQHSAKLENGRSENHFSSFAECHDHGTRQRIFFKKIQTLPSAGQRTLDKEIFLKKNSSFAERRSGGTRQRIFLKKIKNLCRVPTSAYRVGTRQSDRQRNRRRDGRFSLPSVTGALGKAFAECPIKDTRQRGLCRSIFCRVFFVECRTRAKASPSAIWPLPSALGTRQRT